MRLTQTTFVQPQQREARHEVRGRSEAAWRFQAEAGERAGYVVPRIPRHRAPIVQRSTPWAAALMGAAIALAGVLAVHLWSAT